jgi:hypothetical protein
LPFANQRVVTRRARLVAKDSSRLHDRVRGSGIVAGLTSQITLKRLRRPLGDVLRTYKVVIDGNTVGDIRRGETKTFDVPPGRHEIHLEIDWAKSRNLELNLSSGDVASLTCSARPPNAGLTVLASKNYIKLEIVDGSWLAIDGAFRPAPPPAPELAPGAPDDEEMQAAWEAWSQSSDRATKLRAALQDAIAANDNSEIARLKQEVGALLAEHRALTDEYKRLKAQRPDWKTPERSG